MKSEDMPKLIKALDMNVNNIHSSEKSKALIAETKLLLNPGYPNIVNIDDCREIDQLNVAAEDTTENFFRRTTQALVDMYDMKDECAKLGIELKDLFEAAVRYGYQKDRE